MRRRCRAVSALLVTALLGGAPVAETTAPAPGTVVATPAPAEVVVELQGAVETARQRFEARDLAGVLASISEHYRSSGLTKRAVRDQLVAMFSLYQQLRARVTVDRVAMVDGRAWVYTSGEVSGQLPFMGWVTVLTWRGEPEVARREGAAWRLFGFQD
jgi:hypothetical protein